MAISDLQKALDELADIENRQYRLWKKRQLEGVIEDPPTDSAWLITSICNQLKLGVKEKKRKDEAFED